MNSDLPNQITPDSTDFRPRIFDPERPFPWQFLLAGMIVGALVGLLLGSLLPPVYEAQALVTTNMELVQDTNITEIMIDSQIDQLGVLMYHPDIIQAVVTQFPLTTSGIDAQNFKNETSVERRLMTTILKVRHADPHMAAEIASAWAKAAYERLNEAYPHAVRLSQAKANLRVIESCLNAPLKQNLPLCQSLSVEEAKAISAAANQTILEESPLSLGLTVELNVSQYQPAAVPAEPLWFRRGTMVLAGWFVGLIASLLLAETLPGRSRRHEPGK